MTHRTQSNAPAACPECGTPFRTSTTRTSADTLPDEIDCPACHNEPELADAVIVRRLQRENRNV